MFCNWCGKRLGENVSKCSSCGKEQGALEHGNFFGDLCDNYVTKYRPINKLKKEQSNETTSAQEQVDRKHKIKKPLLINCWQVITSTLLLSLSLLCVWGMYTIYTRFEHINTLQSSFEIFQNEVNTHFESIQEHLDATFEELANKPDNTQDDTQLEDCSGNESDSHDKSEQNIISSEAENNGLLNMPSVLETTDGLTISTYVTTTDNNDFAYIVEGSIFEDNICELYWQMSDNEGSTWETIATNIQYIKPNSTNSMYRVICHTQEQHIIDLTTLDNLVESDWYTIDIQSVTNKVFDLILSFLNDNTYNYKYSWQISNNGVDWSDYIDTPVCRITVDDNLYYRLVLYADHYYLAVVPHENDISTQTSQKETIEEYDSSYSEQ